jgi:hypothetical protein
MNELLSKKLLIKIYFIPKSLENILSSQDKILDVTLTCWHYIYKPSLGLPPLVRSCCREKPHITKNEGGACMPTQLRDLVKLEGA